MQASVFYGVSAGLNSPSSSTVSSVASETFTSALRQHQSSMVNMESAFRQLEGKISSAYFAYKYVFLSFIVNRKVKKVI